MTKNAIERVSCAIAGHIGMVCGRCSSHYPKWKAVVWNYLIVLVLVTVTAVAYVEIGHDKGWKRADAWYECLHNHNHSGIKLPETYENYE